MAFAPMARPARLHSSQIGPQLNLAGAQFDGQGEAALVADNLVVTGGMFCGDGFHAVGGVSLRGAKVGELIDVASAWPQLLELHGFIYGDLNPYMPARDRLTWLQRSPEYSAQPYEQLASIIEGWVTMSRRVVYY